MGGGEYPRIDTLPTLGFYISIFLYLYNSRRSRFVRIDLLHDQVVPLAVRQVVQPQAHLGVAADDVAGLGLGRRDGVIDGLHHLRRVDCRARGVLSGFLHFVDEIPVKIEATLRQLLDHFLRTFETLVPDRGANGAGLDDRNVNRPLTELHAQRVGNCLQSEFRSAIGAIDRQRQTASYGADVDNAPPALPEARHERLDGRELSDDVDFERLPKTIERDQLDRAGDRDARIVD